MKIELFINILGVDKNGKQVLLRSERANSFVGNFAKASFSTFTGLGNDAVATNGVTRSVLLGNIYADAANSTYGIVLGTGTTTVTINDYKLQTQIAHGATSGTLEYGSHTSTVPTVVGNYCKWLVGRIFTNSSGAPITVYESGIYQNSSGYYTMIERTIIEPYEIADGVTRTMQYEYRVTV